MIQTHSNEVVLKTEDNVTIKIPLQAAEMSETIMYLHKENETNSAIIIKGIEGRILTLIAKYCMHHKDDDDKQGQEKYDNYKPLEMSEWDKNFCQVDIKDLFLISVAAHYLSIVHLVEICARTVADMIRGKTPEEVKQVFNITGDFTPEEMTQVAKENPWLCDN